MTPTLKYAGPDIAGIAAQGFAEAMNYTLETLIIATSAVISWRVKYQRPREAAIREAKEAVDAVFEAHDNYEPLLVTLGEKLLALPDLFPSPASLNIPEYATNYGQVYTKYAAVIAPTVEAQREMVDMDRMERLANGLDAIPQGRDTVMPALFPT